MRKRVLVTGVGGNVAQGILRNIIQLKYDIDLIGTNTNPISAGNHLCDRIYHVPFSTDDQYIPEITKICLDENIDLIIPSTDYEGYYLSCVQDNLPDIACSPSDTLKVFLDKYQTFQAFQKEGIPFAQTKYPSKYENDFDMTVVKPAEGRGSREININPKDPKSFSDDYIVQEYFSGTEITIAFYVSLKNELIGTIVLKRTLSFGATDQCEVTFEYQEEIDQMIKKVMNRFEIHGSCNIQAIVSDKGDIVPFEVNCRISGTNSIRSNFGFEDVRYTIDERLYSKMVLKPKIKKGAAVRVLMDVIYPDIALEDIKDNKTPHYLY